MGGKVKLVHSLEKVFTDQEPQGVGSSYCLAGFKNETTSFQVAYTISDGIPREYVSVSVESPIAKYIRLRGVRYVPVRFAAMHDADEYYLRKSAGLYPDLLIDIGEHNLRAYHGQWSAVWADVEPGGEIEPGRYGVSIIITGERGEIGRCELTVEILAAELPPQKLIHTKWLHTDCICQYYGIEAFSEEYWRITENFVSAAVRRGINMILTPTHTPPLDTREGGERLTIQLVDVYLDGGEYSFNFEKLDRWVDMCGRAGVEYYEMAHLFTQWGARFTPKVVAKVDGEMKRIFGWNVSATSDEYKKFIAAYLPALTSRLKELGVADRTYFHISDEPSVAHMEHYMAAKEVVAPYLAGFPIMDALSDYDFYLTGAVELPIPANNHIDPFIEGNVPGLWTYYCIGQYKDVSNMFISMPSARNRILAAQLYKFSIAGFLQWGYNFYNSQYSDYPVDPYAVTDGDGFAPSGDPFQVYPGADGHPEESIRMMVTAHALDDLRAFNLLESLAGRDFVVDIIDGLAGQPITFSSYPHSDEYIVALRERVNAEIMKRI